MAAAVPVPLAVVATQQRRAHLITQGGGRGRVDDVLEHEQAALIEGGDERREPLGRQGAGIALGGADAHLRAGGRLSSLLQPPTPTAGTAAAAGAAASIRRWRCCSSAAVGPVGAAASLLRTSIFVRSIAAVAPDRSIAAAVARNAWVCWRRCWPLLLLD